LADALSIGKLLSLDWKLGVSVKSNHCDNLAAPFVTIFIKVADGNDKISAHSFELTISEFQARS
jgi:hypothetical protein